MSVEPNSLVHTVDGTATNNDSDYDEDLAIPDETHHGVTFSSDEKDEGDGESAKVLPFKTIHGTPVKFKAPVRSVFIPNQKIELQIIDHERSVTSHILNPYLYTIELVHGKFSWTIKKRYKHFQLLHSQLKIHRATLNIPFPTKTHRERRTSFKHDLNRTKRSAGGLPRFPAKPDGLIPEEQIEARIQQLQEYLRALLRIPLYRNHHETLAFLEVSEMSFVGALGGKGKEGAVLKRTRSTRPAASAGCNLCGLMDAALCVRCQFVCGDVCGAWRNRWLLVKESCVAYVRPRDGRLRCVMLFDAAFEVSSGLFSTGMRRGLHITNNCRQITIKCPTRRTTREWMAYIKDSAHKTGFGSLTRYASFAPVRSPPTAKAAWLVDGRSYMSAVADAMEAAQEEIFIADWWLSPEIHMKRPALHGDYWRLDQIIKRKAEAGVKIFLLLYKEVEIALGINSFYSKQTIGKCHPENVKVLRHPDHTKAGVFLWAHHEKLVVVDQSVAFVGGIDLCYGRWDDHHHRLTDLGSIKHRDSVAVIASGAEGVATSTPTEQSSIVSLVKMTNSLSVGVVKLSGQSDPDNVKIVNDGNNAGDVSMNGELNENIANEPESENYKGDTPEMQRRTILSKVKENVRNRGREWKTFLFTSDEDDDDEDNDDDKEKTADDKRSDVITDDGTDCGSRITQQTTDVGDGLIEESVRGVEERAAGDTTILKDFEGLSGSAKLWYGKDYTNFIVKDFDNLDLPFQDLVDRSQTPRMPWHDVGAMVSGAPARDVARHFIQRWNAIKLEKAKTNPCYPYLLPKSYQNVETDFEFITNRTYQVSCQVVRSVSQWSAGFLDSDTWEASIHEAYVDVIGRARHYVYIENQFFISALSSAASQVRNQVADALYKRILRAHRERKTFRVYVVIPLLPGFEGEVGTPTGTALHAITHWNYASISRGKDSLIARLKAAGVAQPDDYISFHGLRTHSVLNGKLVTELVYVHSKLLIADDRVAIIGSANINDRSLLGKRDSEIAVVIQDEKFQKVDWAGEAVEVGLYCGSLRRRLFGEHLGLLGESPQTRLMDPVASEFYEHVWRATAKSNTDVYEQVFQCIPSDKVTCFDALKRLQYETPLSQADPDTAVQILQKVKGHLVMLPLEFLSNEVLTPNPNTVTGMMPTSLWT